VRHDRYLKRCPSTGPTVTARQRRGRSADRRVAVADANPTSVASSTLTAVCCEYRGAATGAEMAASAALPDSALDVTSLSSGALGSFDVAHFPRPPAADAFRGCDAAHILRRTCVADYANFSERYHSYQRCLQEQIAHVHRLEQLARRAYAKALSRRAVMRFIFQLRADAREESVARDFALQMDKESLAAGKAYVQALKEFRWRRDPLAAATAVITSNALLTKTLQQRHQMWDRCMHALKL